MSDPAPSHSVCSRPVKYEDAWLAEAEGGRPYAVWAVFDGHAGGAAQAAAALLLPALALRMPPHHAPHERGELVAYAEAVRRAVTAAFLALNESLQAVQGAALAMAAAAGAPRPSPSSRDRSGCTATVVLRTGRLLTVANVGNSRAVLDSGRSVMELTQDHQLGACDAELERLAEANAQVARLRFDLNGPCGPDEVGCGPLRVWPGGLRMSRSLGDSDASPCVLPYPHIKQVLLPARTTRLLLATDGVWNSFDTYFKAAGCIRGVSIANAASALVQRAAAKRVYDDRTAVVVDLAGADETSFKSQLRLDRLSRTSGCSDTSAGLPGLLRRSVGPGSLAKRSRQLTGAGGSVHGGGAAGALLRVSGSGGQLAGAGAASHCSSGSAAGAEGTATSGSTVQSGAIAAAAAAAVAAGQERSAAEARPEPLSPPSPGAAPPPARRLSSRLLSLLCLSPRGVPEARLLSSSASEAGLRTVSSRGEGAHVLPFAEVDAWEAYGRRSYAAPAALLPLIDAASAAPSPEPLTVVVASPGGGLKRVPSRLRLDGLPPITPLAAHRSVSSPGSMTRGLGSAGDLAALAAEMEALAAAGVGGGPSGRPHALVTSISLTE